MKLEIIAQLLGFAAMGVGFLIFQQTNRKRILLLKLICDVLWVTHFAMIGAYSGMAISCIGCFREIVFAFRKEDSKKAIFGWWCFWRLVSDRFFSPGKIYGVSAP